MQPIRTIVEIRYKEAAKPFIFVHDIIRAVGGNPPPSDKILSEGSIRIKLKNKRIVILVEANRFGINIEENLSIDQLRTLVYEKVNQINNHLNWGEMWRVGVRTFWIKEVADFDQLVNKSKEILFKNNTLVNESIDIALPLTLKTNDGRRINYNFGPMTREQLLGQFMDFKDREDIPECFAFIDTDYFQIIQKNYSKNFFKDFFNSSLSTSEKKVLETLTLINI